MPLTPQEALDMECQRVVLDNDRAAMAQGAPQGIAVCLQAATAA